MDHHNDLDDDDQENHSRQPIDQRVYNRGNKKKFVSLERCTDDLVKGLRRQCEDIASRSDHLL